MHVLLLVYLSLSILLASTGWAQLNETDDFVSEWNSTQTPTIGYVQEQTPAFSDRLQITESSTEKSWTPDVSPILKSIRNFLLQARDNFLESDSSRAIPALEKGSQAVADHVVDILEKSFREATTILQNESNATTASSEDMSRISFKNFLENSHTSSLDSYEMSWDQHSSINSTFLTSYSQCYKNLQSCVQKCFVQHNCYEVERSARECPPAPPRICNPFTPWVPTDHCNDDEDCKSPLICCSNGCVQRCTSGVWKS